METTIREQIQKYRSKAVKGFGVFLVWMLLCTIISRGIYAYLMPRVEVGRMEKKTIDHVVEAGGCITAAREEAVWVSEGVLIEEICVREGEPIQKDTLLFRLNTEQLEEKMEELKKQTALCEQRLKENRAAQKLSAQERQVAAARAREDLENVERTGELSVARARQQYEDAQNAWNQYPSWEAYYDSKLRQDSEYQRLLNDPEQEEAFAIYANSLKLSLQEAWAEERNMLEQSVKEATAALQMADNDKNLAILQAKRNLEDRERETVEGKSGVMEEEQAYETLQKEVEECRTLLEQEGKILSQVEGSVKAIYISTGGRTSDTAAMVLADTSRGWVFEATLNEEQMLLLNREDMVTLQFQNGRKTLNNLPLAAIHKVDEDNYLVTVEGNGDKMSPGQMGTLRFVKQEGPYSCCVPLSALHTVDDKQFLYVLREKDTILGTELQVVKRQVEVTDQNTSHAALKEGSLSEEEQFVISADRELAPEDTVRLTEDRD
ncbi:MAG: hypothetical protein NC081_04760 [Roseburia sp.]|nr:hypothetical protein [Roseburia sp.]